jgi:hypothetical protein
MQQPELGGPHDSAVDALALARLAVTDNSEGLHMLLI